MNAPELDKKKLLLGAGLVLVFAGLWVILSWQNQQTLNAWFMQPAVSPGSKTVLRVEVTNLLGKDVNQLTLKVEPKDPETLIMLTEKEVDISYFGSGENRIVDFPVMVSGNAVSGKYSLQVTADLDGNQENKTVFLEVEG